VACLWVMLSIFKHVCSLEVFLGTEVRAHEHCALPSRRMSCASRTGCSVDCFSHAPLIDLCAQIYDDLRSAATRSENEDLCAAP
jgi:hypothetical protein